MVAGIEVTGRAVVAVDTAAALAVAIVVRGLEVALVVVGAEVEATIMAWRPKSWLNPEC